VRKGFTALPACDAVPTPSAKNLVVTDAELKNKNSRKRRKKVRDDLFAKLPIALIKSGFLAELKPASVVVYCVLLSYADFNTGRCFPGIPTISTLSGLNRTTVMRSIKELEDWGLLKVIRRQGSVNIYQLQYWWGERKLSTIEATPQVRNSVGSEATSAQKATGGVAKSDYTSRIFDTLTTTNTKSQINRATVVNRSKSSKESGSSAEKEAKKLVYQLRIADIQQQQSWTKAIQEQFRRLFNKELPAEIIDEKFAQGLSAQFLLTILKEIYDPSKIRNPIGWFRSIEEDWDF
jgi:DNA-binding transcriptional regulator YhcF (GntR family)